MKTRKCYKCKNIFTLSFENFAHSSESGNQGFQKACKKCKLEIQRDYREGKSPFKIGEKFGKLTIDSKYGHAVWNCSCECGKKTIASSVRLRKNSHISCGCDPLDKSVSPTYNKYEEITASKWRTVVEGAKSRGLKFSITQQDVWEQLQKQNFRCYFSGLPISYRNKTASIDRLNNKIGYEISNIALVHKKINQIKMDLSVAEFLQFCKLVTVQSQVEL